MVLDKIITSGIWTCVANFEVFTSFNVVTFTTWKSLWSTDIGVLELHTRGFPGLSCVNYPTLGEQRRVARWLVDLWGRKRQLNSVVIKCKSIHVHSPAVDVTDLYLDIITAGLSCRLNMKMYFLPGALYAILFKSQLLSGIPTPINPLPGLFPWSAQSAEKKHT